MPLLRHRICALITFGYFGIHLWDVLRKKRAAGKLWFRFPMDKDSMLPNAKDVRDAIATFRWFVGFGPRPRYGRWTYVVDLYPTLVGLAGGTPGRAKPVDGVDICCMSRCAIGSPWPQAC